MFLNFVHDLLNSLGPDFFKKNTTEKIALLEKDKFLKDGNIKAFFSEINNIVQSLFLGFVHEVLLSLGEDFFIANKEQKIVILNNSKYVKTNEFKNFLLEIENFDELLKIIKDTLLNLKDADLVFSPNAFLSNFVQFVNQEILPVFDKLSVNFFIADLDSKNLILDKILNDQTIFYTLLKSFLKESSNEEAQKVFFEILRKTNSKKKQITIQSVRDCGPSLKTEIRNHYGEDFFVFFQVNTNILGGMIIYKDGEIQDLSWIGKLSKLQKI